MTEFPPIKLAVQRDMQSLCTLCGEDINSKPAGPHGLVHVDCMEGWWQAWLERNKGKSDGE